MTFVSCPDRDRILSANGHVVVTGGPGCGKTTVALRKALLRIQTGMNPGEKVLFLSFSRAAVARIVESARRDLPPMARQYLDIQTFHSFFWALVRGHGYLLGAPKRIRLLAPHDERALRKGVKDYDPHWDAECERLFNDEGVLAFDLFAQKALALFRSPAIRALIAERYPLIIVDEAQDTGTDQWGCVAALADLTQLVCLADLDQQIYEFRRDVSPERLTHILEVLKPIEINLGGQNNRSPGVEIVQFGNDLLNNTPRGSPYRGISQMQFRSDTAMRDSAIRQAVGVLYRRIVTETGVPPRSIGFLTNWGRGVALIARALQGGGTLREIPHRVVMDEVEVLLSTRVVALCLEPITNVWASLATGLDLLAEVYRAKGDMTTVGRFTQASANARARCIRGAARCPPGLKAIIEHLQVNPLSGNPSADWITVRHLFEESGVKELKRVADQVIYLMGFNRGRRIADSLAAIWLQKSCYEGARTLIEATITEDQIIGGDSDLEGIHVMTMHKSKGKEFDCVIAMHLGRLSPFSSEDEAAPYRESRRLLRVGVTRARLHTLLLTDAYSPSPLLNGHRLK